jgi:hypothetical protein
VRAWEVMEMQIQLSADSLADVTFTSYKRWLFIPIPNIPRAKEPLKREPRQQKEIEGVFTRNFNIF